MPSPSSESVNKWLAVARIVVAGESSQNNSIRSPDWRFSIAAPFLRSFSKSEVFARDEVRHAEFPSCLRFSFTRNKLEKSRKPSSPACACPIPAWRSFSSHQCSWCHCKGQVLSTQTLFRRLNWAAAVVRNYSETLGREEKELVVRSIGIQWGKGDGMPVAPVLVIDCRTVFHRNRAHLRSSLSK